MKAWMMMVFLGASAALLGCGPEPERQARPFLQQQKDDQEEGYILAIALDCSGSFATQDDKAWNFVCNVLDRYMRDRIGSSDQVLIAQLSGDNKPLVWQGTPIQLREDFDSADDFRKMLLKRSDPNGSRIHDGCVEVLSHLMSMPGVQSGKKKCVFLALTDFEDNAGDEVRSRARLVKSLKAFAQMKGNVGFYYVDQRFVQGWRKDLAEAGYPHFVIQSEIVTNPPIPTFEN